MGESMDIDTSHSVDSLERLPDELVQYILSFMNTAKDVAICNSVCRKWRDSTVSRKSLYFTRAICDERGADSDLVIGRMILSAVALENLIIHCPFSGSNLGTWLVHTKASLKYLELRLDHIIHKSAADNLVNTIDSIAIAYSLTNLTLWGVHLSQSPRWPSFRNLQTLEVTGLRARDSALTAMVQSCPNLKVLALLSCEGIRSLNLDLQFLELCRLDFYGLGDVLVKIASPALQSFDVRGAAWITVSGAQSLKHLMISNASGKVMKVECGRLSQLESLEMRGVQWLWDAVTNVLQSASEVKHLLMKIEFTGDGERLEPFPEIDFVEFFNSHPKLTTFEVHGAMFAALSQRQSLARLTDSFSIPCLKEIVITVRSPLNADQKVMTLEAIVRHSRLLRKLLLRVSQMKNCEESADKFFERVMRFKMLNDFVKVV